ncbi:MAG: hypothetical protein ACYCW6_19015 [Candidatus Xenobia bacterium]
MQTDPLPRQATRKKRWMLSDAMRSMPLPDGGALQATAAEIERALKGQSRVQAEKACRVFASHVAETYQIAAPAVTVLGVRPHRTSGGRCVYELFGDYTPSTQTIRIWMKTAMQHKVTSYGTLLSTLCHELCHHLDVVHFGFPDTDHTRGFYERTALLYHLARGTPVRPLTWVALTNGGYRIDWVRTMKR